MGSLLVRLSIRALIPRFSRLRNHMAQEPHSPLLAFFLLVVSRRRDFFYAFDFPSTFEKAAQSQPESALLLSDRSQICVVWYGTCFVPTVSPGISRKHGPLRKLPINSFSKSPKAQT